MNARVKENNNKKSHFVCKFYDETKTNPMRKKKNCAARELLYCQRCLTKKFRNFLTFVVCLNKPGGSSRCLWLRSRGKSKRVPVLYLEKNTKSQEKVAKVKLCHDNDSDDKIGQIHFVNALTQFMNICTYLFQSCGPIVEFFLSL